MDVTRAVRFQVRAEHPWRLEPIFARGAVGTSVKASARSPEAIVQIDKRA
jgi:hypothetical protein